MSSRSRHLGYEQCPKCAERGKDSRRDNLSRWEDGSSHCWSCGYHHNPSVALRWNKPVEELEAKTKRILPDDFTWEVPARCWEWLLQYGLPYEYWQRKVGYSPKYERLVFRVGDPLKFSLGRLVRKNEEADNQGRKWHVWGDSHNGVEVVGSGSNACCLVEDILSAHKVGQVTQSVCLFGTRIYPAHIQYLREQGKDIILWLDSDQGTEMPKKAANLNILTGCKVNIINSEKDPKYYDSKEIADYISSRII